MASKGHFLTQIPQPLHSCFDKNEINVIKLDEKEGMPFSRVRCVLRLVKIEIITVKDLVHRQVAIPLLKSMKSWRLVLQ
jgi:hypothetical protein